MNVESSNDFEGQYTEDQPLNVKSQKIGYGSRTIDFTPNPARKHTRGRRGHALLPAPVKALPKQLTRTDVMQSEITRRGIDRDREKYIRVKNRPFEKVFKHHLKGDRSHKDSTAILVPYAKQQGYMPGKAREIDREFSHVVAPRDKPNPWQRPKRKLVSLKIESPTPSATNERLHSQSLPLLRPFSSFKTLTLEDLGSPAEKMRELLKDLGSFPAQYREVFEDSHTKKEIKIASIDFQFVREDYASTRKAYASMINAMKVTREIYSENLRLRLSYMDTLVDRILAEILLLRGGVESNPGPDTLIFRYSSNSAMYQAEMAVGGPGIHCILLRAGDEMTTEEFLQEFPGVEIFADEAECEIIRAVPAQISTLALFVAHNPPAFVNVTNFLAFLEERWGHEYVSLEEGPIQMLIQDFNHWQDLPYNFGACTILTYASVIQWLTRWRDFAHTNRGAHALNGNSATKRLAIKRAQICEEYPLPCRKSLTIKRPTPSSLSTPGTSTPSTPEQVEEKAVKTSTSNNLANIHEKRRNACKKPSTRLIVEAAREAAEQAGTRDAQKELDAIKQQEAPKPLVTQYTTEMNLRSYAVGEANDEEGLLEMKAHTEFPYTQDLYFFYGRPEEQSFYECDYGPVPIPFLERANAHLQCHARAGKPFIRDEDMRDQIMQETKMAAGQRIMLPYACSFEMIQPLGPQISADHYRNMFESVDGDAGDDVVLLDLNVLVWMAERGYAASGCFRTTLTIVTAFTGRTGQQNIDHLTGEAIQFNLRNYVYTALLLLMGRSIKVPSWKTYCDELLNHITESAALKLLGREFPLAEGRYYSGYTSTALESLGPYADKVTGKITSLGQRANIVYDDVSERTNQAWQSTKKIFRARAFKVRLDMNIPMPAITKYEKLKAYVKRMNPMHQVPEGRVKERMLAVIQHIMSPIDRFKDSQARDAALNFQDFPSDAEWINEVVTHLAKSHYSDQDKRTFTEVAVKTHRLLGGDLTDASAFLRDIKASKFKVFDKAETYDHEAFKTLRQIVSPEMKFRAYGWALFHHAERSIIRNSWLGSMLIKEVPVDQIAVRLDEEFAGVGTKTENDYTSFESTITRWMINNVEMPSMARHMQHQCSDDIASDLLHAYYDTIGHEVELQGGIIRVRLTPMRLSGTFTTSIGNAIANAAITITSAWDYLEHVDRNHYTVQDVLAKVHFKFEGDDGLAYFKGRFTDFGKWFTDNCSLYGCAAKAMSSTNFKELNFCGNTLHDSYEGGTIRVKNIMSMFANLSVNLNPDLSTLSADPELLVAKAMSYKAQYPQLRPLVAVCDWILRKDPQMEKRVLHDLVNYKEYILGLASDYPPGDSRNALPPPIKPRLRPGAAWIIQNHENLLDHVLFVPDPNSEQSFMHAVDFASISLRLGEWETTAWHALMDLTHKLEDGMYDEIDVIKHHALDIWNTGQACLRSQGIDTPNIRERARNVGQQAINSEFVRTFTKLVTDLGIGWLTSMGVMGLGVLLIVWGIFVGPMIIALSMYFPFLSAFGFTPQAGTAIGLFIFLCSAGLHTSVIYLGGVRAHKSWIISQSTAGVALTLVACVTVWRTKLVNFPSEVMAFIRASRTRLILGWTFYIWSLVRRMRRALGL